MTRVNSIIGWYGGKFNLAKHFLPFPVHTTYVEVFGGSAVVLFNKIKSEIEIVNDINSRLINMWKVIQSDRRKFVDYCQNEGGVDSRQLFEEFKNNISGIPEEDAMRFFYINHHSFSQMNESFHGMSFTGKDHWHTVYLRKLEEIDSFYNRIKNVEFENQDFRQLIKRCDREDVLIFLDPPYFKGGELYENMAGMEGNSWTQKDFDDLKELLFGLEKAKFVMTVDDDGTNFFEHPDWFYQKVERINAASLSVGKEKSRDIELVIRNFDPDKTPTMKQFAIKDKVGSDLEL